MNYDVIVAGAGPAGLSAAAELSNHGFKVLLIEKDKIGQTKNTWACFADDIKQNKLESAVSTFVDEVYFSAYLVGTSAKKFKMGVFDQNKLLSLLKGNVNKKNCKMIEYCEFIAFSWLPKKEGITIKTNKGDFSAKLLIDAAGYKSPTNTAFGLQNRIFVWQCLAYEIESANEFDEILWDFPFPADIRVNFWIDKITKKKYSVGLMYFTKELVKWDLLDQYLEKYIRIKKVKVRRIIKKRSGTIAMNNFEIPYDDNILRIGNAASHASPDAGYGLINAIDDGRLIKDTVIKAFKKNDFSKRILKDYHKRWKKKYTMNYHFAKIIERVHHELDDVAFSKVLGTFKEDDEWLERKTRMDFTKGQILESMLKMAASGKLFLLTKKLKIRTLLYILKETFLIIFT